MASVRWVPRGSESGFWLLCMLLALAGCGGDAGPADTGGWTAAAERIRPSVHSVWGSRAVLGGERTAFAPLGTAFVVGADGLLLTNAHVVALQDTTPVARLHVLVQGEGEAVLYPARIEALDLHRDLALVRIAASGELVPVSWALDGSPTGAPVATLGYGLPEGGVVDTTATEVTSRFTVYRRFTAGYSSGYRTLTPGDPSTNVLEVDLFLFPGVSGGPAFDRAGRVVGVNRGHRRWRDGVPTSYGHVIPRNVVAQFLELHGSAAGADTTSVFGGTSSPP